MYLLDTNTLIYFFKGQGDVAVHLFAHAPKDIFIPTIVLFELEVGIAKSNDSTKRREQLQKLLSAVQILDFTHKEAKESALIRAELERKGMPIGPMDTLIAGCARANALMLVSRNLSEFERVDELKVESWF